MTSGLEEMILVCDFVGDILQLLVGFEKLIYRIFYLL
jgi:hypothetical protein